MVRSPALCPHFPLEADNAPRTAPAADVATISHCDVHIKPAFAISPFSGGNQAVQSIHIGLGAGHDDIRIRAAAGIGDCPRFLS